VAVVGHVEWVTFARVTQLPEAGEIVHAEAVWDEAAGGGGVAAVQLARLTGDCLFITALGTDSEGERCADRLHGLGVDLQAARRSRTRRAFTHTDAAGERTITVLGDRLVPCGADDLPWAALAGRDAVYFTGGDAAAVRAARAARVLVATPRGAEVLTAAGVPIDALVHSGGDPAEMSWAADLAGAGIPLGYVVATAGGSGGRWTAGDGTTGQWAAADLEGPVVDAYGCGDSFAAGLTLALGRGEGIAAAVSFGAACGARCLTGAGPYGADLRSLA